MTIEHSTKTQKIKLKLYIYAYFSKYGPPMGEPSYSASLYEMNSQTNHVLVKTIDQEHEFLVPEKVEDFTAARLAVLANKLNKIQLAAAEEAKEVNDEIQKLLCIEHTITV